MENFYDFIQNKSFDSQVVGLYLQEPKMTILEIANKTGKSVGEIYRILQVNEINPNRLKTNHQRVESLAKVGWGIKEIAEFTGYSTRNVRYILKGKP